MGIDINPDQVELYATSAQALNLASSAGRVTFLNTGEGQNLLTQEVPEIKVSKVTQIQAPVTDGFKTLYAFDEGRIGNLTLLADIAPEEINPRYRRIKVGTNCAAVSMKYLRQVKQLHQRLQIPVNLFRDFKLALLSTLCFLTQHEPETFAIMDKIMDDLIDVVTPTKTKRCTIL